MLYSRLRPLFFLLDPERAHAITLSLLRLVGVLPPVGALLRSFFAVPPAPVRAFGLDFKNPVGLAAGYDKDGLGWRGLACLGFGHIEIGTVTPKPQPGNPKPRLFRLPQEQALINRMGFPSLGAGYLQGRLQGRGMRGLILGVNLGKNKDTPLEKAAEDYLALMKLFAPLVDYLAINVSSPNTIGLRRLQARDALEALLKVLVSERMALETEISRRVPVLVKLAPDLNSGELDDALQVITSLGLEGVIAANTTISREGLGSPIARETGGLSGAPLRARSTEMVRQIYQRTNGMLPIIAVGGIMNARDAKEKLDAGAVLVQLYTGLVYAGPGLVGQIVRQITTPDQDRK